MGHVTYGFGRRLALRAQCLDMNSFLISICVGMHFANQTLFINIATILWALDIKPTTDKDGVPKLPSLTRWKDDGIFV
jgi:hypothetical protein